MKEKKKIIRERRRKIAAKNKELKRIKAEKNKGTKKKSGLGSKN